jgi:hypothetical protein
MNADIRISTKSTHDRILTLLTDLPPEGLAATEQFLDLLRKYAVYPPTAQSNLRPSRYPTVTLPASSLDAWLDLTVAGYAGDALADTEAVNDEA